jgi:dihydropteroate synthase
MRALLADAGVDVVVMHSLTVPADRTVTLAPEADPVEAVLSWSEHKLRELEAAGLKRSHVILDPGIGFGKTPAQSLALLKGARRFRELGARVLLGHSRKSFLSLFTGRDFAERDVETLAASLELARAGVDYLRVHNVEWHARALRVEAALR